MAKRPTFEEFKKESLQDKEVRAEYDLLEAEFALLEQFIKARKKVRCSQSQLAEKLNVQQPAIARLEKGGYSTTSVAKLARVADALGYSMKISLKPKKATPASKSKSKKS